MNTIKPSWKPSPGMTVGKGATVQQFVATVGNDKLEIEVAPWGEGALKVNGVQIAQVKDANGSRGAFRDLKNIAERHMRKRAAVPVVPPSAH
jgi:enoyl-[acyl-carrier protein] reductase I